MIRRNGDGQDPAEAVGRVLTAKRAALLRAYRDRLLPDDLEDCLSQATLELVARARREALAGDRHSFVGLLRVCALSLIWEQRNPGDSSPPRYAIGCAESLRSSSNDTAARDALASRPTSNTSPLEL